MDLSPYIQSLRDDLLNAAAAGDDATRRAATLLATAIEPSARLALMSALSDLAAEVTGSLEATTVDLRLDGRDVRVTVTKHDVPDPADWSAGTRPPLDGEEDLGRAVRDASGELSRTTLRLFNDLKTQAEQAADAQGVSLNTYIQRAVSDAVRSSVANRRTRGGRSVTGYVRG